MSKEGRQDKNSAIQEIKNKIRLLNAVVTFVIVTLLAVIIRYLYEPVSSFLDFLPDISVTLILGIVFFLALLGALLSVMLSRQTLRIIQDFSNRLDRVLNITMDLREEIYGDILLEKIMDAALSMTQSKAGSILLLDDDNQLIFKIVGGVKASELIGTSVEKGSGIAGWVLETGQPVRISNAYKDERFDSSIDSMTGMRTEAVLCVPLKTKSGTVGVLELLNREGGFPYRQRDEEIITYLAEQAAISIIITQFYEDQRNFEIHVTEMLLEAIDFHIHEKTGHARRVSRYSNIIAKALNMSEEEKKRIYFASLLHDVGFLKISNDDAYKKDEYLKHPVIGYEMIKPINIYADIAPIILHHHEWYDGTGYPSGLKDEGIPLGSRIIAVAEAFDAMVCKTSYRVPVGFDEAREALRRFAGTQFDPKLVEIFLENVEPEHIQ
jgi:hypothetical protein